MALTQISTAGVKDDAVTSGKIPANAVGTSEIADTAVTLAKLEHGTGSNDGKFLRANNGADPTFETVTSTTLNGNTDHQVMTGTGTANTLQGESGLTYNGSTLGVSGSVAMTGGSLSLDGHPLVGTATFTDISGGSYAARLGSTGSSTIRSTQIYGGGGLIATFDGVNNRLGIGTTTPAKKLHVFNSGVSTIRLETGDSRGQAFDIHSTNGSTNNSGTLSIRNEAGQELLNLADGGGTTNQRIDMFVNGSRKFRFDNDGLKFGSDTAAANALDDYEEGTWTPTTANSGGGFQNMVSATYTKIGRLVNISVYAVFNNSQPNSNQIRIGGLPYQSISAIYHYAVGRLQGFAANDISWQVGGTSDYLTPYYNNTIPTYNQVAGYYFLISGSYITDS